MTNKQPKNTRDTWQWTCGTVARAVTGVRMVKAVLEHSDSLLSYGTEDLAQYKDLPQTTTRIVLGCAGAASSNPYLCSEAGYAEHCFVMRITQFPQIHSPTKLVLRSTKAQLDTGLGQPTKWCVLLYPNGNQPERQGYVSLYLYRLEGNFIEDTLFLKFE